ncbi:hypothetical protein HYS93_00625 [Candidatus Daviesbacteria bacterium]|nr:hypothetical protein [Candidatus Daviesbacteria bacterium]
MVTTITSRQLKDVLMDSKQPGIKESYFYIESPNNESNLTVLSPGKNGNEFNKTLGFFHRFPGVLIYRCLYGQGIIVIQKNDSDGEAKEFRVVGLRSGVEVEVPSGYGHTIINIGKNFLVTIDNAPKDSKYRDYETVKNKKGLVYYIIDKKGDVGFDSNPNYSFHPQITT